jgi:predicted enzyme related to lactoylglutathione lyase
LGWTELATPDVPAAKSFYSDVLGWQTDDQPMGEFTYTVVRPAGGGENSGQGGIMPLSPEMAAAGATTRWQPYFEVADCDAAAAAVTANGGTVVVPASDIPGVGRFAIALDPDGAQFGVIASVPA